MRGWEVVGEGRMGRVKAGNVYTTIGQELLELYENLEYNYVWDYLINEIMMKAIFIFQKNFNEIKKNLLNEMKTNLKTSFLIFITNFLKFEIYRFFDQEFNFFSIFQECEKGGQKSL